MDWLDLLAVQGTLKSLLLPQFKSINSLVLSFLYSPTVTSITQSSADRITTSLSLAHQKKNRQTKNSAQISPYKKLSQTTGPTLGGQKPKGRKNSTLKPGKGDLKHNKFLKNEKAEKYYINEGTS